jgi:hypothetical protein
MNPNDHGQHPHDPDPHKVQYFLPGQVLLHLEHPAGVGRDVLTSELTRYLQEPAGQQSWRGRLAQPKPEAILTYPVENDAGRVFSIVPTMTRDPRTSQEALVEILLAGYRQLRDQPVSISSGVSAPPITLNSVSPNWLMSGTRHGIGTGGPGAWPVMADLPPGSWPKFNVPAAAQPGNGGAGQGAGVHVAILDTAPGLHELVDAYDKWRGGGHPLLEGLLGPGGALRVYSASYEELQLTVEYSLLNHRYRMADHGLFVAGIIHTLAPQATLHLYEVLDPYGVGCLETIAAGILKALQNPNIQGRLIVNCSLVLDVPLDGHLDPDFPVELRDPATLEHMTTSLRTMFDRLSQANVVAVAAAGNDAHGNKTNPAARPPARYPAAFESVIGVGALPKHGRLVEPFDAASYSNLSDAPAENGYSTIGGEQGVDQGVLGVYIGDFPEYCGPLPVDGRDLLPEQIQYHTNKTGWAWWAGTSFAAPVISGILAASQTSGPVPARASDVANTVLTNLSSGRTGESEKVVLVEQN